VSFCSSLSSHDRCNYVSSEGTNCAFSAQQAYAQMEHAQATFAQARFVGRSALVDRAVRVSVPARPRELDTALMAARHVQAWQVVLIVAIVDQERFVHLGLVVEVMSVWELHFVGVMLRELRRVQCF
jgi:hypothetical protein